MARVITAFSLLSERHQARKSELAAKGFGKNGGHKGIKFDSGFTLLELCLLYAPSCSAKLVLDLHRGKRKLVLKKGPRM